MNKVVGWASYDLRRRLSVEGQLESARCLAWLGETLWRGEFRLIFTRCFKRLISSVNNHTNLMMTLFN